MNETASKKASFLDFTTAFETYWCRESWNNPGLRMGQAYMNLLRLLNPNMYHAVPWDLDPYQADELIPVFLQWIQDRWDEV